MIELVFHDVYVKAIIVPFYKKKRKVHREFRISTQFNNVDPVYIEFDLQDAHRNFNVCKYEELLPKFGNTIFKQRQFIEFMTEVL